jgi:hypothetical protein
MKRLIAIILLIQGTLSAEYLLMGKHELPQAELLIKATEKSLEQQKQLHKLLKEYIAIQDSFQKSPADNKILSQMVFKGSQLFQLVKEAHLEHNFSPDFLNELTVLDQFAQKGRKK